MRHSRIMHLRPRNLQTPRPIMHQRHISEPTPHLISRRRILARPIHTKPQRLVLARISSSIAAPIANPQRTLRERNTDVILGRIYATAHTHTHDSCNVDPEVVRCGCVTGEYRAAIARSLEKGLGVRDGAIAAVYRDREYSP